jgi:hypothetical protein
MWYFSAPGRFLPSGSPAASLGHWTIYVEVADDQLAARQLGQFRNGNILCYDREHSRDEFGYLTGLRFSQKPKWRKFFPNAEMISLADFDALWYKSLKSPECMNRDAATDSNLVSRAK